MHHDMPKLINIEDDFISNFTDYIVEHYKGQIEDLVIVLPDSTSVQFLRIELAKYYTLLPKVIIYDGLIDCRENLDTREPLSFFLKACPKLDISIPQYFSSIEWQLEVLNLSKKSGISPHSITNFIRSYYHYDLQDMDLSQEQLTIIKYFDNHQLSVREKLLNDIVSKIISSWEHDMEIICVFPIDCAAYKQSFLRFLYHNVPGARIVFKGSELSSQHKAFRSSAMDWINDNNILQDISSYKLKDSPRALLYSIMYGERVSDIDLEDTIFNLRLIESEDTDDQVYAIAKTVARIRSSSDKSICIVTEDEGIKSKIASRLKQYNLNIDHHITFSLWNTPEISLLLGVYDFAISDKFHLDDLIELLRHPLLKYRINTQDIEKNYLHSNLAIHDIPSLAELMSNSDDKVLLLRLHKAIGVFQIALRGNKSIQSIAKLHYEYYIKLLDNDKASPNALNKIIQILYEMMYVRSELFTTPEDYQNFIKDVIVSHKYRDEVWQDNNIYLTSSRRMHLLNLMW